MDDHLGSPCYQVKASKVMIDDMEFISLVSISLLHLNEHHPDAMSAKWTDSNHLNYWLVVTNTHGYES
jgi:hypothetical protein